MERLLSFLDLDDGNSGRDAFIDGSIAKHIEFDKKIFSGGEVHFKLKTPQLMDTNSTVIITKRVKNGDGLMEILMAKNALENIGFKSFELIMPYVPYARQDRICDTGEAFSLKVFASIINNCKFDKVHVFDAHSDVAPALIDNCINYDNINFVRKSCFHIGENDSSDIVLISPDAGANKKSNKLFGEIRLFSDIVKCDKKRDLSNGKLSGFTVFCDDLKGKPCLIVDDIIDGGGTFIGIAEELKKKNAGNLYLFVTHGIFSNGFDTLGKYFKRIYTTDSFIREGNSLVTVFNI